MLLTILEKEKAITVRPKCVVIGNGPAFGSVLMSNFLRALAKRLKRNTDFLWQLLQDLCSRGESATVWPCRSPLGSMFCSGTFRRCCQLKRLWSLRSETHGSAARRWNCPRDVGKWWKDKRWLHFVILLVFGIGFEGTSSRCNMGQSDGRLV